MPNRQRTRDAALILPILGAFLLISPAASVFDSTSTVLGLPVVVLYVFGVWLGMIVAALALARRLSAQEDRRGPADAPEEPVD
jgi:Sec-independent protein secretion pathway component TatC